MPNPVTVDAIAARLGRTLTESERAVIQARLDDAWELILGAVPSVEARLGAGSLRPGLVLAIESSMVLGVPIDVTSAGAVEVEEAIDDYRKRTRYADSTTSSSTSNVLRLTDEQKALLMPAGDASSAGAWTIRPYASRSYGRPW